MLKKNIQLWLFNIVKNFYNLKESEIFCKTYIEDSDGYKYLKKQYKFNKILFENNLIKSIKNTQNVVNKKYKKYDKLYNLRV